jgi:hypothetical protein
VFSRLFSQVLKFSSSQKTQKKKGPGLDGYGPLKKEKAPEGIGIIL